MIFTCESGLMELQLGTFGTAQYHYQRCRLQGLQGLQGMESLQGPQSTAKAQPKRKQAL